MPTHLPKVTQKVAEESCKHNRVGELNNDPVFVVIWTDALSLLNPTDSPSSLLAYLQLQECLAPRAVILNGPLRP